MAITREVFGYLPSGEQVDQYTLTNSHGLRADFLTLGAVWRTMYVPDGKGHFEDVVLGYDDVEGYLDNAPHFGAVVGRNANRIAGGSVTIGEREYRLEINDGPNNLHSGSDQYHGRIWECEALETGRGSRLNFYLESPDGDQGFPGNLSICVSYTLTEDDAVEIEYRAESDQDTIVNLTNHSYFNLAGQGAGSVLQHQVWIGANYYTPADQNSIPTGEIAPVSGTPMDFTKKKALGKEIDEPFEALIQGRGYDHNWLLNPEPGKVCLAALAEDPVSGRTMRVYTDLPGIQLYTANFLDEKYPGKAGARYRSRDAVCFETQHVPDACHKDQFPSPYLKAGDIYHTTTIYRFG